MIFLHFKERPRKNPISSPRLPLVTQCYNWWDLPQQRILKLQNKLELLRKQTPLNLFRAQKMASFKSITYKIIHLSHRQHPNSDPSRKLELAWDFTRNNSLLTWELHKIRISLLISSFCRWHSTLRIDCCLLGYYCPCVTRLLAPASTRLIGIVALSLAFPVEIPCTYIYPCSLVQLVNVDENNTCSGSIPFELSSGVSRYPCPGCCCWRWVSFCLISSLWYCWGVVSRKRL